VVGSSELLIVSERVDVEALLVQVVSGVSLSFVGASVELPRTLVANVTLHRQLTHKYQVLYTTLQSHCLPITSIRCFKLEFHLLRRICHKT